MASTHTEHNLGLSNDYSLESAMEGVPNPIPVPITQAYSGNNSVLTGLDSPMSEKSPMPQSETLTTLSDTSRSPYSQSSNLNPGLQQGYVCDQGYQSQSNYSSNQQPVYHQMGVSGAAENPSPLRNNDYNQAPKQPTPPSKPQQQQASSMPPQVHQNNDQGMIGNSQTNEMGMSPFPPPSGDQSQYQYHYHNQMQTPEHQQSQSNYQYPPWQPPIEPPHQHQNSMPWQQQQDMSWQHQQQTQVPQQDHSFQTLQQQPNQDQSQQQQQQYQQQGQPQQHYSQQPQPDQHYNYSSLNYNQPQYYQEQAPPPMPPQQQYHHQMLPPYMPTQNMPPSHQQPQPESMVPQQPGNMGNNQLPMSNPPSHQGTGSQLPPHQETGSQLPQHQGSGSQLPQHQGSGSQLPPHQGSGSQLPPHQGSGSQLPPYQGSGSQLPPHQGSGSQLPPHQGSSSQLPPHQGSGSQLPPHQGSGSQLPPHQGSGSQLPPHQGSGSQLPPHQGSGSQLPPHQGSGSQLPPHQGSGSQLPPHQGSSSQLPPHQGSGSQLPPHQAGPHQAPTHQGTGSQLPPHQVGPHQAPTHQGTGSQLPPHQTGPHQAPPAPSQLPPASQRLVDCVKKSQEKFDKPPDAKPQPVKQEKPEKQTKAKPNSETAAPRGKGTKRKNSDTKETPVKAGTPGTTEENTSTPNAKVAKKPASTKPAAATTNKPGPASKTTATAKPPATKTPATKPPATKPAPKPAPNRKNAFERKNIRDIINDEELEATTVAAQKEEQERKRRLQEAQQRALVEKFNQVIQEAEQETAAKAAAEAAAKAEAEVAEAIKKELEEEAEALAIKNENMPLETKFIPLEVKKETDVILVESSDDDDKRKRNLNMYSREAVKASFAEVNKQKMLAAYQKNIPIVKMNPVITVSSSDDESSSSTDDTSSDDDDDMNPDMSSKKDDDCVMVLSDDDDDDDALSEDPNNSGSHTNDLFNQPDPEGRVLINVGHPPEEEDIFLAPQLSRAVKAHQIGGIRFLYDNVVESISRFQSSSGFGCILAHSMGLGKTIQVISLTDTFLRHTPATTVLCIVPINTIQNWMSEFNMWLPPEGAVPQLLVDSNEIRPRNFPVYLLNENYRTTAARAKVITEWRENGGVMLMGYEMYRMLALKKPAKVAKRRKNRKKEDINPMEVEDDSVDKKLLDDIFLALVNPGPDLVVCDEGHRIKNCSASTSSALKKIHTKRRVVLTGYPLQNNLLEYWCMVDFVRPNYLGSRSEFVNMFERPIQNGQCIDSTPRDIQLMRYRAHVLHSLLEGFVQRRGHAVLRTSLPVKEEHVILCRMTDVQRELYREFVRDFHTRSNSTNPLLFFAVCCKIWNHPDVLYNFVKNLKSQVVVADNDLDIDLVAPPAATDKASNLNKNLVSQALNANQSPINHSICASPPPLNGSSNVNGSPSVIPANGIPEIEMENKPPISVPAETSYIPPVKEKPEPAISYEWAKTLMETYKTGVIENCHKMAVLFAIIEQSLAVGDKLLVFSQSLLTLDLIERFLNERQIPDRPNCPVGERWSRNFNYCRLDGKTHAQERERLINNFNNNQNMYLFLLSTRAGCLGINLIGANRIVVYDASWNPCHDAQAVCRIYRYGQQKPCYIYRLVTDNCLEKKVYDRQVNKQGMSDRVVDELNPESNFTWKEVSTLVSESEDDGPEQDFSDKSSKYVDHLLQYICNSMSRSLSREPFEHESLLLDRKELKLTKHEKKMAKQSYELEKRGNAGGYGRGYTYYSRGGIIQRGAYQGRGPMTFASPTGIQGPRFLPGQSTPVPNQWNRNQKNNGATVLIRAMLHQGVMVRRVTPSNGDSSTVTIPAGQEVLVMRTPKGVYLRVPDGRIIAVRLPQELLNQWQAIGTTTTIGLGPQTPRPNLLRTHLMTSTTTTGAITTNSKGNFGTNIVQANLQCGGSIKVDGNPEVIDLSDDEEKQRSSSISPNSSLLSSSCSSSTLNINNTMTSTTMSAGAINKLTGKPIPRIIRVPIPQNELKKTTTGPNQPARIIIRQMNRNPGPNIHTINSMNPNTSQAVTFTRQNTLGGTPSVTITRLPISSASNTTGGIPLPAGMMGDKQDQMTPNLNKNFSNMTIKRAGLHQPSVTVVRPGMQKNQPSFRGGLHGGPQGKVIVKKSPVNNVNNAMNSGGMELNQIDNKIDESSKQQQENKSDSSSSPTMPGMNNPYLSGNANNNGVGPNQQHMGMNQLSTHHVFPDSRKLNENAANGNVGLGENLKGTLPGQSILQKPNMDPNLAKMGQINPARIINTYSPRRGRGGGARGSKQATKRNNTKNNSSTNNNNNSEMFMNHNQQDSSSRLGNMNPAMVGQLNEPVLSPRGNQPNMGENQPPFINTSGPPLMQNSHNPNQQGSLGHNMDGSPLNSNSMMDYGHNQQQSHHMHQQQQQNEQQQQQQQQRNQGQQHNHSMGSHEQSSGGQNNNSGNNSDNSMGGGLHSITDSNQAHLNQTPMNQSQTQYNSFENPPQSRQSPAKHLTLLGEPPKPNTTTKPARRSKKSKNSTVTSSSASSASSTVSTVTNPTFTYGDSLGNPPNMGFSPMDQSTSLRSYGDDPYSYGMYDQNYYPAPPTDSLTQNRTDGGGYNHYGLPNQGYSSFSNPVSNSLHFGDQGAHMPNYYDPAGVGGGLNSFGHYSNPHAEFNYNPYGHSSSSAAAAANHTFLPSYESFSSPASPKFGNEPASLSNLSSTGSSISSRQSPFPNSSGSFSPRNPPHFLTPSAQQGNNVNTSSSANSQMQGYGFHQQPYNSSSPQPLQNVYNPPIP